MSDDSFISRWAKRKAAVREGKSLEPIADLPSQPLSNASPPTDRQALAPVLAPLPVAGTVGVEVAAKQAEPVQLPTLEDTTHLTPTSDFTRFVAPNVDPAVKNAALKKLFADPHFNVMDGLDTYIDDYGKPDPIPLSMLKTMVQSHVLGLFAEEPEKPKEPKQPHDQDLAVRLQSHDAPDPADPPASGASPEPDPGREC